MSALADHKLRYQVANELHARPSRGMSAPSRVVFIALKPEQDAANRDRDADRAHLIELLDRHGAAHPKPGATHLFVPLGKHILKWEALTELTTYTMILDGESERPFDPADFDVFPMDWLARAPGQRLTSAHVTVLPTLGDQDSEQRALDWLVPQSLAISHVVENAAMVAADFQIDAGGHLRFAVFTEPSAHPERIGRIVQRLLEMETYKSLSMLGFFRATELSKKMASLDSRLSSLIARMTSDHADPQHNLEQLLEISKDLELLVARSNFRFGATQAYAALVEQRIDMLMEVPFNGRQTLRTFMQRRYQPAMRTVASASERLQKMVERAARASDLLRTQVDVRRSRENQELLASMNRRAEAQLQLQRTVEGLSVVAISYYSVSLLAYLTAPFAQQLGLSKAELTACLVLPVVGSVWFGLRWVHARIEKH